MPDRMSEYMPEGMSDRMYIYIYYINYRIIELYNFLYTSRWYVRNYVRIVCQGGDHSKKICITYVVMFSLDHPVFLMVLNGLV